jgi:predicted membrane channel-forming protein YqfA (hemolysin III family)
MNKIKTMSLYFICLLNLLVISSSYAEVKSSSPEQKEILTQAE